MIDIKSPAEIEIMYTGGHLLSEIAGELKEMAAVGITTMDIEKKARELFGKKKVEPAFLNYGDPPFPATICTSINDEIVHGIPSYDRELSDGDILSVDLGGIWNGFYTDMAFTVGVGNLGNEQTRIMDITREALETGTSKMYTNNKLYDISWSIQRVAEDAGFSVVRCLVGHGVGRSLHEPPQVPNYGKKGTGMTLKKGMVFALEPMLNAGTYMVKTKDDNWTVVTADGRLSCHFENTVAVTDGEPRKLTELYD
ncbi:MAG: type I methionyl aminopeptidase [Elusimicrobiota bacterium]